MKRYRNEKVQKEKLLYFSKTHFDGPVYGICGHV